MDYFELMFGLLFFISTMLAFGRGAFSFREVPMYDK